MTEPAGPVFLSYASQDAEAAQRICAALRAAGIEVFLDQSALRGGDAWDQRIRHEIHNCALFVPLVSRHTQERLEGYFRHEWNLAIERTHHMAQQKPFLVPVVVDGTGDQEAFVPDAFRAVQWTHLPHGQTPPDFAERIRHLLSAGLSPLGAAPAAPLAPREPARLSRSRPVVLLLAAVFAVLAYFVAERFWIPKAVTSTPSAFAPPPHSIAVLPFVNLSGDKEQDYFSDGLTEELLNSLAEIDGLQVAARTSSFSFKEHPDIATVAHKLNVGAVLEGSVRRSANRVRITAQLINAVTGFHVWSKTYDRDLGDVLQLQTEIATAVAGALKLTLLADVAAKVELGGTRNPAAFDAYLRGEKALSLLGDSRDYPAAIAAYTEAIRLDPHYALAFAARSMALSDYTAAAAETEAALRGGYDKAQADARQALVLAPDLAQGHLALANVTGYALDFPQTSAAYERALALAPGNAQVLRLSGEYAAYMGHFDVALAAARRAVVLDPLARQSHSVLGRVLYTARRYSEAVAAFAAVTSLEPQFETNYVEQGLAYYGLGDLQTARASCETHRDYGNSLWCLAVIYEKLGRHADAQAQLSKLMAGGGDSFAYQYAIIYAQWGNRAQALKWLETALRLHDAGLEYLKTDPLLDPLREEPRFQAIERELKFPN